VDRGTHQAGAAGNAAAALLPPLATPRKNLGHPELMLRLPGLLQAIYAGRVLKDDNVALADFVVPVSDWWGAVRTARVGHLAVLEGSLGRRMYQLCLFN
jgi:hypothetical protein